MARLQRSFEVDGELSEVFAYVTTPTHRPTYLPSVAAVRQAADEPVQAGGGWEERAAFGPLKKWLKVRAVVVEAPSRFAYEPDGGPGDGRVTWTLSAPAEGRVRVEVALDVELPRGLRVFDRLVPVVMAGLFKTDVEHLEHTLAGRSS
jgi:uncharacterized protein YndB with AHSA1/START domain